MESASEMSLLIAPQDAMLSAHCQAAYVHVGRRLSKVLQKQTALARTCHISCAACSLGSACGRHPPRRSARGLAHAQAQPPSLGERAVDPFEERLECQDDVEFLPCAEVLAPFGQEERAIPALFVALRRDDAAPPHQLDALLVPEDRNLKATFVEVARHGGLDAIEAEVQRVSLALGEPPRGYGSARL